MSFVPPFAGSAGEEAVERVFKKRRSKSTTCHSERSEE
jgi:hypothetical protein